MAPSIRAKTPRKASVSRPQSKPTAESVLADIGALDFIEASTLRWRLAEMAGDQNSEIGLWTWQQFIKDRLLLLGSPSWQCLTPEQQYAISPLRCFVAWLQISLTTTPGTDANEHFERWRKAAPKLKRHANLGPKGHTPKVEKEIAEARRLIAEGVKRYTIARRQGITPDTLRKRLNRPIKSR